MSESVPPEMPAAAPVTSVPSSSSSRPPALPKRSEPPRVRSALASSKLLPLLRALALGAGALLALNLFGLMPAREPHAPKPVKFEPANAIDPVRLPERDQSAPRVHKMLLWSFPLCARPAHGARLYRVALRPERDSFVVWCQGEYVLVDVDASAELPRVSRLARFAARGERPGGATALDLDYDGVLDLALGVSPAPSAVHRPFSGVFWLRGRAQGGFELPRTLVEMPVIAVQAAELDDAPGSELVVLTRGDAAAQRAGDLWVFAGGTSPTRVAVVPTALAPSDLAQANASDGRAGFWISSTQPGSLVQLRFARTRADWSKPERIELPLRGVQGFVQSPRGERALYVRDAQSVLALEAGEPPKLVPWLNDVEVGPAAWLQTGRENKPSLLAATEAGFAWFQGDRRRDRSLPKGTHMLDASTSGAGALQARGVLLLEDAEQGGTLSLAVLPVDVRDEALELELRTGALEAGPAEARVALE